ncbi:MAG TPA: helix-turn-helix domain-containing protein [Bryobacteraceae bacterium]|jgi:TetR/AcrR family fatty acid metabolism transcriptional regulator
MTDQSVSERKRTVILRAARAVFSRQGYAATAVDDIAEEAGIAKGTLYLYFKSKEELYLAALACDLRELASEAAAEMDRAATFREQVRAFLEVRMRYAAAHEDFLRIYLAEYGSMFVKTPLRNELRRVSRDAMRHMARAAEAAMKRGELRRLAPGAVAAVVFDVARGLVERRLLGWKEFQTRGEIAFAVDLLWSGIGRENRREK